jgi:hypothetical protein
VRLPSLATGPIMGIRQTDTAGSIGKKDRYSQLS